MMESHKDPQNTQEARPLTPIYFCRDCKTLASQCSDPLLSELTIKTFKYCTSCLNKNQGKVSRREEKRKREEALAIQKENTRVRDQVKKYVTQTGKSYPGYAACQHCSELVSLKHDNHFMCWESRVCVHSCRKTKKDMCWECLLG